MPCAIAWMRISSKNASKLCAFSTLTVSSLALATLEYADTAKIKRNMKRNIAKLYLIGIAFLLLGGCEKINAITGSTMGPKVIKYDRNQAEFSLNFWRYITSRVSANRLEKGKIKLKENQALLNTVYQKYGIPPSILVAFWGLETNYGKNVGKMNLVRSLWGRLLHAPIFHPCANQYA
jgi:hypothetical protein